MFRLKKIIKTPTINVKILEYSSIREPNIVAVAPKDIKTIENPTEKSKVSRKIKFFFLSSNPSNVVPLINEI